MNAWNYIFRARRVNLTHLLRIRHKSLTSTKTVRIKSTANTYLLIVHKLDTNSKHFITIRINSPLPYVWSYRNFTYVFPEPPSSGGAKAKDSTVEQFDR